MITGYALRDFLKWLNDSEQKNQDYVSVNKFGTTSIPFEILRKEFQETLIINWFDSVGIYIEISGVKYQSEYPDFTYNIQEDGTLNGFTSEIFISRKEALETAIKKANEIYNQR